MVKKIQSNGNVCIPKKVRRQLSSNEVKIYNIELNGKVVAVVEPIKEDKKCIKVYE